MEDHFKYNVRKYDTLESEINNLSNQIKPLNLKLKDLKKTKSELQSSICDFMETNDIGECKLQTGSLQFKESKNVAPLSKSIIKDNIYNFFRLYNNKSEFNDATLDDKSQMLFSYVYENREYNKKNCLKRIN